MRLLLLACALGLASSSYGCASRIASSPSVRVLASEPAHVELPAAEQPAPAPRIGPPGGSGAGARRVAPAQSGNDTVDDRPVETVGGSGLVERG